MKSHDLTATGRLVLIALGIILSARIANAAIVRPFTLRFTATTQGNVILVGNTLETCSPIELDCVTAQTTLTSTHSNNIHVMTNVDVDTNSDTFNASSALITLRPEARVLWAGLYWGASNIGLPAPRVALSNTALLATPSSGYVTITANHVDINGTEYQGFADVTTLVQLAGSGIYTAANVQAGTGTGRYAGWSLVVVYGDPAEPLRNLSVFDGYGGLNSGTSPTANILLDGFVTPASGPVTATIGIVTYEGDRGVVGDRMLLNGLTLSNTVNTANDFFNSTLSNIGELVLTGNPAYTNTLGFDIDTVDISGLLSNGATSATITLVTAGDAYYPGVVTFVSEVFAPALTINKSVVYSPSPSNTVRPGDVLTYQVAISSSGSDIAAGVILTDLIPTHTTYISGSAAILLGANAGPQTDVPGDDEFELLGTGLVFRLGAGATSTQGGSLALSNTPAISNSTTIQFAVRVSASLTQTTVITNQAEVIYVGSTLTTTQFTATSNNAVVTVTVEATHTMPISLTGANLSLIKTVSPATAINGDWITYTLVVSNAGPQDMPVSSLIKVPSDTVVTLGPADRYPATLNVQGLSALTDISVTLRDVSHGYVADLDVLLVGPQGQSVLLMSDAGGTTSLDHATLSFHTGSPSLPDATQILTGTYGPTDFVGNDGKDVFPAPAPSTHTLNLSSFIGTSPNGEWKLFINDDQADDVGTVAKGWSLTLFTKDGRAVFDSSKPVQALDPLPVGLKFVSASPGYGQSAQFGWGDALPANTTRTYTLTARVERPTPGGITNTAQLRSSTGNATVLTPQTTANVAVQYIELSADVSPSVTVIPGHTIAFTIEHCNTGNITATGVLIAVKFPPGLSSITLPAYWVANSKGDGFDGPIGVLPPGTCGSSVFYVGVPADWRPSLNDLGVKIKIDDDGTHGLDPNDLPVTVDSKIYLPLLLK